jgi:hypothetical protein
MTADERGAAWVRSLSDDDKQLLRDHAGDRHPPGAAIALLNRGPFTYSLSRWENSDDTWSAFMMSHITDHP